MIKQWLLFSTFFLAISVARAQSLKLLNATEQGWSGGVCCRVGINYVINTETPNVSHPVIIDTVWIGDKWYSADENKYSKTVSCGKAKYRLIISDSWDTNNNYEPLEKREEKPGIKPPAYKGRACIIYTLNGHKKSLAVKSFTELQAIAYP